MENCSQRLFRGLCGSIAFVRVNVPVGQLPLALPKGLAIGRGVVAVIGSIGRQVDCFKWWQGCDWRRRYGAAFPERGVLLPVHAREPDRSNFVLMNTLRTNRGDTLYTALSPPQRGLQSPLQLGLQLPFKQVFNAIEGPNRQ
jgi:hypothetical protein